MGSASVATRPNIRPEEHQGPEPDQAGLICRVEKLRLSGSL